MSYVTFAKAANGYNGWIVSILGVEYKQCATAADAVEWADDIRQVIAARTDGTPGQVRELYKLGAYESRP
jgi:hypothetical protein